MRGYDYDPYTLPTISFVGGSTQELAFHAYFAGNNKPLDLTAATANFDVVSFVNKMGDPILSKTMTVGKDTEDSSDEAASNVLWVTLDPADTVNLYGKYIYQVSVRDVTGVVEIPQQGILMVTGNIGRQFVTGTSAT